MPNKKPFSAALVGVTDLNDLVGVYDRNATAIAVTNTVNTAIWSKSIGASALGSDWALHVFITGELRDESAQTLTLQFILGATTMSSVSTTFALAATQDWRIDLILANLGASNSQKLTGSFRLSGATTGTTVGTGGLAAGLHALFGGAAAEDTTAAKTLQVNAQWGGAPAVGITKKYATAVLL